VGRSGRSGSLGVSLGRCLAFAGRSRGRQHGRTFVEVPNFAGRGLQWTRAGRGRCRRRTLTFAHQLLHHVPLIRVQGTELVFHIQPCLATDIQEIFALDVQLARQCENSNFLSLQAQLPLRTRKSHRRSCTTEPPPPIHLNQFTSGGEAKPSAPPLFKVLFCKYPGSALLIVFIPPQVDAQ
jgi:hypothetical protein